MTGADDVLPRVPDRTFSHARRPGRYRWAAVPRVLVATIPRVHGPRSVGKSTVLHALAADRGVSVIDLDDPAARDAVLANVSTALGGPAPVCLDEYQHAPRYWMP